MKNFLSIEDKKDRFPCNFETSQISRFLVFQLFRQKQILERCIYFANNSNNVIIISPKRF